MLLTQESVDNDHIVRLLARWRKKHEVWFPALFPVSGERTRSWLQKRVMDEQDRLLFMLQIHGTYIGHVGLYRFDFARRSCEIDNIVRGVAGYPGIMQSAIICMMVWGNKALDLNSYTLQTTSDNKRALTLYKKLGFVETKRVSLVYNKTTDGGAWEAASPGYKGSIRRYDVYMKQSYEA